MLMCGLTVDIRSITTTQMSIQTITENNITNFRVKRRNRYEKCEVVDAKDER